MTDATLVMTATTEGFVHLRRKTGAAGVTLRERLEAVVRRVFVRVGERRDS